jgi:hypothetical protein
MGAYVDEKSLLPRCGSRAIYPDALSIVIGCNLTVNPGLLLAVRFSLAVCCLLFAVCCLLFAVCGQCDI